MNELLKKKLILSANLSPECKEIINIPPKQLDIYIKNIVLSMSEEKKEQVYVNLKNDLKILSLFDQLDDLLIEKKIIPFISLGDTTRLSMVLKYKFPIIEETNKLFNIIKSAIYVEDYIDTYEIDYENIFKCILSIVPSENSHSILNMIRKNNIKDVDDFKLIEDELLDWEIEPEASDINTYHLAMKQSNILSDIFHHKYLEAVFEEKEEDNDGEYDNEYLPPASKPHNSYIINYTRHCLSKEHELEDFQVEYYRDNGKEFLVVVYTIATQEYKHIYYKIYSKIGRAHV